MAVRTVQLPRLTVEEKWHTAEGNLIYFIICGIVFAKSEGKTAEDFGTCAGIVAAPSWEPSRGKGPQALVEGISENKQQFREFQLEILADSVTAVQARMKGYGENDIRDSRRKRITVDDYVRFFEKKWIAIADYLGLEYEQRFDGEWTIFTVAEKK